MITLTRLSGSQFLLNADLIERVDSTPDTVITLVDGKKYVVSESISDVLGSVVAYRGEIVALSSLIDAVHASAQSGHGSAPTPRRSEQRLAAVAPHPTVQRATTERSGGESR